MQSSLKSHAPCLAMSLYKSSPVCRLKATSLSVMVDMRLEKQILQKKKAGDDNSGSNLHQLESAHCNPCCLRHRAAATNGVPLKLASLYSAL